MPKWLDKLKAQIAANPLYWDGNSNSVICSACGGHGKKVPLYRITNYNEFRTCKVCKVTYR